MSQLDVVTIDVADVVSLGDRGLRDLQSDRVRVLVVALAESGLVSFVGLAPTGRYLGQEWWLGQSYVTWRALAAADKKLTDRVAQAVKKARVSYDKLPLQLLSPGGWFLHRYRSNAVPMWDRDVVISATFPESALAEGIRAIESSATLVEDYAFKLEARRTYQIADRFGVAALEKAFPVNDSDGVSYRTAYRYLDECEVVQQSFEKGEVGRQKKFLASELEAIDELDRQCAERSCAKRSHRQLFVYFLNAAEFAEELAPQVRKVNLSRARLLRKARMPHFMLALSTREPDVANEVKNKFSFLPSDRDWLVWLQKKAPFSFSNSFEELSLVDEYIESMKVMYPCFGQDPLQSLAPKETHSVTHAAKLGRTERH